MHIELKYFNPNSSKVSHYFSAIKSELAQDYLNDVKLFLFDI